VTFGRQKPARKGYLGLEKNLPLLLTWTLGLIRFDGQICCVDHAA